MSHRINILLTLVLALGVLAVPAGAVGGDREVQAESEFLQLINDHRAAEGLSPLQVFWDLVDDARVHSRFQADGRCADGARICHNTDLGSVTNGWTGLGENVGVGYDVPGLDRAFWNSPGHRANVLGDYNYAGVGVHIRPDETLYVTVVFMRGPAGLAATNPEAGIQEAAVESDYAFPAGADRIGFQNEWGRWQVGSSDFFYGMPGDQAMSCDWDGDGVSTAGLYRPTSGYLYLRNSNDFGVADVDIFYGMRDDVPVCGDWDGDGVDSIGVYRPAAARFFLRNSNDLGFADVEFDFGEPGDIPLAGDWFGQGHDSIAVFRPATGTLFLTDGRLALGNVVAVPRFDVFDGDILVAGDWDADGIDTIGFARPAGSRVMLARGHEVQMGYDTLTLPSADLVPVAGSF